MFRLHFVGNPGPKINDQLTFIIVLVKFTTLISIYIIHSITVTTLILVMLSPPKTIVLEFWIKVHSFVVMCNQSKRTNEFTEIKCKSRASCLDYKFGVRDRMNRKCTFSKHSKAPYCVKYSFKYFLKIFLVTVSPYVTRTLRWTLFSC